MPYLVTAPLVLVKVSGGDSYRVDYHYAGSVIPELDDEQEKRFLAEGLVEKVGGRKASKGEPEGAGDPGADPVKPAHVATKDVWVDYVVAKTANTDSPVSREEAESTSKADLIELYG